MGEPAKNLPQEEIFNRDLWEPDVNFSIEEAQDQQIGGQPVLAKVRGEFFVPNGISRNKRFYPRELWEKVCKDTTIRKRLDERRMFGTIGHNQKIDDDALREGKMSHIMTDLAIEGDKGIGEALILDTPAGRILNTCLRAGAKLFVSSRADGRYNGEQNGIPRVDPARFFLETFDFVLDPGFTQANPKLVESLEQLVESLSKVNSSHTRRETMGVEALAESLSKENGSLKINLENAIKEIETLKAENTTLMAESKSIKSQLLKLEAGGRLLEKYKALGSPEDLGAAVVKLEEVQKFFEERGTQKEIVEALEAAKKSLRAWKTIGKSPREVTESLDKLEKVLDAYQAHGTPEDFAELVETSEKLGESLAQSKAAAEIAKLSKELGVSEAKIKQVYGKMPEKELREFFKDIKESKQSTTTARQPSRESQTFRRPTDQQSINEGKDGKNRKGIGADLDKPRVSRLMEQFTR